MCLQKNQNYNVIESNDFGKRYLRTLDTSVHGNLE